MSDQDKDLQKPDATEERTSASPRDKSSPSSPGPDAENTNRVGNASPTEHVSDVTHEAHEQSEQQKSRQDQGQQQQQQQQTQLENLRPPVRTLKEAFPDVDVEVIEAILESQRGHVEPSFEILLGMSDPSYQPEMPPRPTSQAPPAAAARQTQHTAADDVPAPPMPPRPTGNYDQYGNFQQAHREPRSVEEQMRMDEEYARQIALEEERLRMQQYQRQRQSQQENEQPLFNFQEELPIIKERMIEAGNVAKKKVLDLYNQFKAARANNQAAGSNSSIPTTNAQYRGLPRDEADDLLAGDVSALRLSDNDVYAQTTRAAQRQSGEYRANEPGIIHVNSPLHEQGQGRSMSVEEQIRADEELARRLAREDQAWENRRGHAISNNERERSQVQRSEYTSSDGEPVTLTATTAHGDSPSKSPTSPAEPVERRSYVIRDEDDSDDDDLVDVDDETKQNAEKVIKEKAS